jgi:hypothetical protein
MTLPELNALWASACVSLDAGAFDAAITTARKILLGLATFPNTNQAAGGGSRSLAFNGTAGVEAFIAQCQQGKAEAAHSSASSGGIFRQSKVRYHRPSFMGDRS